MRPLVALFLCAAACALADSPTKAGHSRHGAAFDEGPRQKPWKMDGIGRIHFPITTKNPEVQQWFNQGVALLHSFWYFEAERSFRWCLKLEPDNPMPYWGLARSVGDDKRRDSMIREAGKRLNYPNLSPRERLFIEADLATLKDPARPDLDDDKKRSDRARDILEDLILKYPDDLEARLAFASFNMWESPRPLNDTMFKSILAKQPDHPGAHHLIIHNWNHRHAEQALDSSKAYGEIATGIGHALHMPGHIYATVGMWHEAAIAMDSATRAEAKYMRDRLALPYNTWNYGHNRDYLCYIQEQLGLASSALAGARELLSVPLDPKYNKADSWSPHGRGEVALLRALVKFERSAELLDDKTFTWAKSPKEKAYKAYGRTMGYIFSGKTAEAQSALEEHSKLAADFEKGDYAYYKNTHQLMNEELRALILLLRGDTLAGLKLLTTAAEKQYESQKNGDNDPPSYPGVIYNRLGLAYLDEQSSPKLAIQAFEKTLEVSRNDGYALLGLIRAYRALGNSTKANEYQARLNWVWAAADESLRKHLNPTVRPDGQTPRPERNYQSVQLERFGPPKWEPYAAPLLDAVDAEGKRVSLADYRDKKNVLLVFYLGEECPHCLDQLVQLAKRKADLERNQTVVLAISPASPAKNKESKKLGDVPFRLVSDENRENAKRFLSYDDFEEQELHSTILIDKQGRVHWLRLGGDPFTEFDFLFEELGRLN